MAGFRKNHYNNGCVQRLFHSRFFLKSITELLISSRRYLFYKWEPGDGIFMLSAIIRLSAISLFQESRSRNALKLKNFRHSPCKVIRNSRGIEIKKRRSADYKQRQFGGNLLETGKRLQRQWLRIRDKKYCSLSNETDN